MAASEHISKPQVPETIVFALDLSDELRLPLNDLSRMVSVKDALKIFIHTKLSMLDTHSIGLISLAEEAKWLHRPTSAVDTLLSAVNRINPSPKALEHCNIDRVFELVEPLVKAQAESKEADTPSRVVRLIIVWARSGQAPLVTPMDTLSDRLPYLKSPNFVVDGLFLRQPLTKTDSPDAIKRTQAVYDTLVRLHNRGFYWDCPFPTAANTTAPPRLFSCFASFLSHSTQRDSQQLHRQATIK